jgi:succinoglycan biosynthesis transport protein ExoP
VEAAEQQSFPIAEARIITAATPPIDKSAPKGSVILGVSGIVGLAAGLSLAFLREAMDSSLRTPADVQSFVGVPYLGSLPVIPSRSESSSTCGKGAVEERKRIKAQSSILSFAVEQPFSEFAETVRRIKVAADMSPSGTKAKVIGVISSVSGEGRTTLASNLAQVAAESGARVLLLDLDLRRPALSSDITQTETTGFRDGLAGEQSLYHEVWHDSITRLEFLPSMARKDLQQAAEGASTPDIPGAFASFRIAYDYVIIDLAPVSYSVDAKVISPHVDGFVFVIEAGRTPRQFVGDALTEIMSLRSKVLGIVLNKTKPSKVWKIARRSGERRLV